MQHAAHLIVIEHGFSFDAKQIKEQCGDEAGSVLACMAVKHRWKARDVGQSGDNTRDGLSRMFHHLAVHRSEQLLAAPCASQGWSHITENAGLIDCGHEAMGLGWHAIWSLAPFRIAPKVVDHSDAQRLKVCQVGFGERL